MKQNNRFCPECKKLWKYCECDQLYPQQDLIDRDDELILDSWS